MRFWEPEEIRQFVDLPGPAGGEAWTVAFSSDSRALAAGYDDEAGQHEMTLALWNLGSELLWERLKGHRALVYGVTYSPDGKTIASSGFDKSVRLCDVSTGELRQMLTGHREKVRSVAYLPDGSGLVSGARDGTIRVWDARTGAQRLEIAAPGSSVHCVVVTPDGKSLIAAVESSVCICDLPSGHLRRTFKVSNFVAALALSQDGSRLAAGNESGEISMWDFSSGAKIASLQGHLPGKRGAVLGLAFTPDGKTLASAGEDKTLRLWQVSTDAELLCFKGLPAAVNGVAFSPDGAWLAAALHNGVVRLWSAPREGEEL